MTKHIVSVCMALTLLASPLLTFAQTTNTPSNDEALIATLTQLVQILEQRLQQIISARQGATSLQTPQSIQASYGNTTSTTNAPVISSVSPNTILSTNDRHNTQMTLYGSNLSHVDQILYYFNGRNVHGLLWPKPPYPPSFHEFIATPASLQFPDFASGSLVSEYGAGKYQIAVEIPEGISNKLDLTIVQNPNVPTISSISPNSMASADLGAPITIYGSNLLNTPQVIFSDGDGHGFSFAASSQQMLQNTSNKMIIRLDSYKDYLTYGNPVGKYQVTVDTPDGTSNKLNFEVK